MPHRTTVVFTPCHLMPCTVMGMRGAAMHCCIITAHRGNTGWNIAACHAMLCQARPGHVMPCDPMRTMPCSWPSGPSIHAFLSARNPTVRSKPALEHHAGPVLCQGLQEAGGQVSWSQSSSGSCREALLIAGGVRWGSSLGCLCAWQSHCMHL